MPCLLLYMEVIRHLDLRKSDVSVYNLQERRDALVDCVKGCASPSSQAVVHHGDRSNEPRLSAPVGFLKGTGGGTNHTNAKPPKHTDAPSPRHTAQRTHRDNTDCEKEVPSPGAFCHTRAGMASEMGEWCASLEATPVENPTWRPPRKGSIARNE